MADIYDNIDRTWSRTIGGGGHVEIDDKDFQILTLLAPNARIPTKDISKKLNISTITVKNRIKRLTELKVIQGYKVDLDFLKMGYYYFKAGINLFDYHKRKKLICYLIENPNLIMIDESAGFTDLEPNFIVKNVSEFYQIMDDLMEKFPDTIQNYVYYHFIEIHKWRYLPDKQY